MRTGYRMLKTESWEAAMRSFRGLTRVELLSCVCVITLAATVLLPAQVHLRSITRREICAGRLGNIGYAMHVYSNDNSEWFPIHYFDFQDQQPGTPPNHGIRWLGTMGSSDGLRISEATTTNHSPRDGHPSRSLFLLVAYWGEYAAPHDFICPASPDEVDDLMNYGPDAQPGHAVSPARPGIDRFDFRGYRHLSYGYQLPYGRRGRPWQNSRLDLPILADKGPYTEEAGPGLKGTRTSVDRRNNLDPPNAWRFLSHQQLLQIPDEEWRPYNSRNHGGEGQNTVRPDNSVTFARRPIAGSEHDNIYTLNDGFSSGGFNPGARMVGMVPWEDETVGPLTNTDSFIVP